MVIRRTQARTHEFIGRRARREGRGLRAQGHLVDGRALLCGSLHDGLEGLIVRVRRVFIDLFVVVVVVVDVVAVVAVVVIAVVVVALVAVVVAVVVVAGASSSPSSSSLSPQ